jgi:hypothetical protein
MLNVDRRARSRIAAPIETAGARRAMSSLRAFAVVLAALSGAGAAHAEDSASSETIAHGRQLITENGCNGACHQRHAENNDPLTFFTRPNRRVHDRAGLQKQVERCVSQLASPLPPEDIAAIVAALDHDYYKFK